jgi:abortive infection bacteriophage resistance protein
MQLCNPSSIAKIFNNLIIGEDSVLVGQFVKKNIYYWGICIEYADSEGDWHDSLVPEIEEFDQLIESFQKIEKNNFKGKVSFSSSAISQECNFKLSFKGLSISEMVKVNSSMYFYSFLFFSAHGSIGSTIEISKQQFREFVTALKTARKICHSTDKNNDIKNASIAWTHYNIRIFLVIYLVILILYYLIFLL